MPVTHRGVSEAKDTLLPWGIRLPAMEATAMAISRGIANLTEARKLNTRLWIFHTGTDQSSLGAEASRARHCSNAMDSISPWADRSVGSIDREAEK